MNYLPVIDSTDLEYSMKLMSTMKAFNIPPDYLSNDLSDVLDVQTIMKEGRIQDLSRCIQHVLNYNLNSLTSNTHIKVLDPSFVNLVHVAQFIIKFLLFWKTNLFNENVELQTQLKGHEQLLKELSLKKLEVRDLRKQLSLHLRSKNTSVSECSQCKKVFVNDTYLYAHHKRRHGDQLFITNKNEIEVLQNEIQSLKQQLIDLQGKCYNNSNTTFPSNSIKMRIIPEIGCLETQEMYWKGRLKELCDRHEEEKQKMKEAAVELKIENDRLNRKINDVRIVERKSVETQTEPSNFVLNSKYFQPIKVEKLSSSSSLLKESYDYDSLLQSSRLNVFSTLPTHQTSESKQDSASTTFRRWSIDTCCKPKRYLSHEKDDIVDEVNSFLTNLNRREELEKQKLPSLCREKDRKVIAKCFTSEQLVNKLIGIYDKQESSVSDDENSGELEKRNTDETLTFTSKIEQDVIDIERDSAENENGPNTLMIDDSQAEDSSSNPTQTATINVKPKSRLFPFLKNIPTKIMKNYHKSRKVCVDVIEDKIKNRSSSRLSSDLPRGKGSLEVKRCNQLETTKDQSLKSEFLSVGMKKSSHSSQSDAEDRSSEHKLVSALKKSKSTGNLAKKVMFQDELPNVGVNFKSNFSELPTSEISQAGTSTVIGMVDVHYDKFAIPIPAPRAKKNISTSAEAI